MRVRVRCVGVAVAFRLGKVRLNDDKTSSMSLKRVDLPD